MNAPGPAWPAAAGWRDFLDRLSDPIVVLDARAHVVLANTAALRLLPCEAGVPIEQLQPRLGATAVQWLRRAAAGAALEGAAPALQLADGSAAIHWHRLDAAHSALRLVPQGPPRSSHAASSVTPAGAMREAIALLWDSPFPTVLQGSDFRFVDANAAFLEFLGLPREQVIGRDALDFQPPADHARVLAARERIRAAGGRRAAEPGLIDARMIDVAGRERRYRALRRTLVDAAGQPLYLAVLQDTTAEHVAREHADRSLRELDDWFDLSPVGMVLFDERGLLLRTNRSFEALTGAPPVTLADAGVDLQQLLGWDDRGQDDDGGLDTLEPDAPPLSRQVWVAAAGGRTRLLRATLRSHRSPGGRRRFMAAVEDRSAEEERDIAQSQVGALIDSAGVGLATFHEAGGGAGAPHAERASQRTGAAALQSIRREIVAADSLPEFERLQHALRHAERVEVRYAIDHPTLGRRWLVTRVEPATLASGRRTTSVVTLDVTEQQDSADARLRAERAVERQAERTRSILDSVLVGIVTVGAHGIEWMNRSAQRMFGGSLAELAGLPIETVASTEPGHPFRRADRFATLAEGTAETFECRVTARDGREFSVVGNVVCTAREGGGRQLTYALLDIERRREAEARMSQAQAQLQRIIEAAPLAITLRDARTLKVVQINAVAAAHGGLAPHELIGRTPEQLFDAATAAQRRADMEQALATRRLVQREYRELSSGEPRLWDARYLPLSSTPDAAPDQLLLVATDVTEQRAAQEARLEAAIAQREMLVREVHHRIKNNLQGVAGLLQQIAQRKPEVAGPIAEVVGQVHAIAQVYGLQVGADGPLQLLGVLRAIALSVQRTFGREIGVAVSDAAAARWTLPEAEAIPIALTLNELLTNAVKHGSAAPQAIACRLDDGVDGPRIAISNPARLPDGFSLARIPGGVSGLGLVRALLPRRGATLTLEQHGDLVEAALVLKVPVVTRDAAGATA